MNSSACKDGNEQTEDLVQYEAANYIMLMKVLQDVPAFILGLFCGSWSDKIGRKIPMILPCFGGALVAIVFAIIHWIDISQAFTIILVGIMVNSLLGRNSLITMAVHSYIADISTDDERTRRLGSILAMNFFGLFAGALVIGVFSDMVQFGTMFFFVGVLYILTLCMIVFFLPESRITATQRAQEELLNENEVTTADSFQDIANERYNANTDQNYGYDPIAGNEDEEETSQSSIAKLLSCFKLQYVRETLYVLTRTRPSNARRYLIACYVCICFHNMSKSGEIDVLLLFVKHTPLKWTKSQYGYLLAFQYSVVGTMLLLLLPFLSGRLRLVDTTILCMCLVLKAIGLTILGFATSSWMIFVANCLISTFGMIISCTKSLISKIVEPDENGKCFSLLACSETVADLIGVVTFTRLYYIGLENTTVHRPYAKALPFFCMAGMHIGLLFLALFIRMGGADAMTQRKHSLIEVSRDRLRSRSTSIARSRRSTVCSDQVTTPNDFPNYKSVSEHNPLLSTSAPTTSNVIHTLRGEQPILYNKL